MRLATIAIILCCFLTNPSFSQPFIADECNVSFIQYLGQPGARTGSITLQDSDDDAIYIGGFLGSASMITKMSINGEVLWARTFDFTDRPDHIVHLSEDISGDLIGVSFAHNDDLDLEGAVAFRYNPLSDNIVWVNYYNTAGVFDHISINPSNNNLLAAGVTNIAGGDSYASLAELDRNTGNVVWRKEYEQGDQSRFHDLDIYDNNLYATGYSTFDQGADKIRVSLSKMDLQGNVDWSKNYLIPSTASASQLGTGLVVDDSGITSCFWGDPNGTGLDTFAVPGILKTDLQGNLNWANAYNIEGYQSVRFYDIQKTQGGYLCYGFSFLGNRDLIIIKIDESGEYIWGNAYGLAGDNEDAYANGSNQLLQRNDNLFLVGRSQSIFDQAKGLVIKALEDGTVDQSCAFSNPLNVDVNEIPNPFEGNFSMQEVSDPAIIPQSLNIPSNQTVLTPNLFCTTIDTIPMLLEVNTCPGTPYLYNGEELAPNSSTIFTFTDANGCDSMVLVEVGVLDALVTSETIQACEGESVLVFGEEVFQSGIFVDTLVSTQGCDSIHTVEVSFTNNPELLVPDGALSCVTFLGELDVIITGGTPPFNIEWSDGQTATTAVDLETGTYTVSVSDAAGCMSEATGAVFEDFPVPTLDLDVLNISCFGADDGAIIIKEIFGASPPFEYSLDGVNFESNGLFQSLLPGAYTLFIRNSEQCESTLPITIEEPIPLSLVLPNDTTLFLSESLEINPLIQSSLPLSYEWSPDTFLSCSDCPNPIATPLNSTEYTLMLRDTNDCTISQRFNININERSRVYIPNAFSPNNDGRNDFFTLFVGPEVERVLSFQVYNRWGGLMYRQDNFLPAGMSDGWDGTLNGEPLKPAVFAYYTEVLLINGERVMLEGTVHLVR
jgi:gliding motility-associated-like protein